MTPPGGAPSGPPPEGHFSPYVQPSASSFGIFCKKSVFDKRVGGPPRGPPTPRGGPPGGPPGRVFLGYPHRHPSKFLRVLLQPWERIVYTSNINITTASLDLGFAIGPP